MTNYLPSGEYKIVYKIGDAEIFLPFNRTVVASIISELLINYTQDFGV